MAIMRNELGDNSRKINSSKHAWPLKGRNRKIKNFFKRRNQLHSQQVECNLKTFYSNDDEDPESFHRAISFPLALAQFFGIFPVCGVRSKSIKKLRFRKAAPRAIYAYLVIICDFVMAAISLYHMVTRLNTSSIATRGGITDATVGLLFYGNNLVAMVLFLRLATQWAEIQRDWKALEQFMDKYRRSDKLRLCTKFAVLSSTVLSLALVEHILSIMNSIDIDFWKQGNSTVEDFLDIYMRGSHSFIVKHVGYSFPFGGFMFCISRIATFSWNFMDLFVMLVSTGLAERYKHLNQRILGAKRTQMLESDWHDLRQNYAKLSTLVKFVDNKISSITLLSFMNNLYFICLQLLNGLSPKDETLFSAIYFFGSFFFLVGRTTAVTLLAARINDHSKAVLPYLFTCPASNYTIETQRLQQQLTTDEVALTGLRFFYITRNFLLAIGGAICTYEVVLIQFNIAISTRTD